MWSACVRAASTIRLAAADPAHLDPRSKQPWITFVPGDEIFETQPPACDVARGISGAVQGYDQILATLVQTGQMRASDAGLARIALTLLAKAGPDGKPETRTAFAIQNGQMSLGPAKLGRAPRLTWE